MHGLAERMAKVYCDAMTDTVAVSRDRPIEESRMHGLLEFLQAAEQLKDTLRSGTTRTGRRESTAEHSWRLALMVLLFEKDLGDIDLLRLVKLCIVHDLGEAISGDVPAPLQRADDDREARERRDFLTLCKPLPEDVAADLLEYFDEYAAAETREARLAKGFDKLETMLQHLLMPPQAAQFYEFNLSYGNNHTDANALTRQIRSHVDQGTQERLDSAKRN